MIPPGGYTKLPDGVRCRCPGLWRDPDSQDHWCCLSTLRTVEVVERGALKLCTDCAHLETRPRASFQTCSALVGQPSAINGQPMHPASVSEMRTTLCGWNEARFFKPKE